MGVLSQRIPPRKITHQEEAKEPPHAPILHRVPTPPPPGTMPPLFAVMPAEPPPSDWRNTQPWRKRPPDAHAPRRRACAYSDNNGALYIGTPPRFDTFTKYTTIEAYNHRSEVPRIVRPEEAPVEELVPVELLPDLLRVQKSHPDCG